MMGGRRDGLRPISTYSNAINTLFNIEQGLVVGLFGPTYVYFTIPPTISSLGGGIGWSGTYIQLSHKHQQYLLKTSAIYHVHPGYGRYSACSETYIQLSL